MAFRPSSFAAVCTNCLFYLAISMSPFGPLVSSLLAAAVLWQAITGDFASAQWAASDRQAVADQMIAAAENLDASRFPELKSSTEAVQVGLAKVRKFFTDATDAENQQQWLDYLDVDPLTMAIESGESMAEIGREAIELRTRLVGTAPGLELSVLRALRDDLAKLIEAVRLRDGERAKEQIATQLQSLAERVVEMDESPSAEDVSVLTAVVGLLDGSNQSPELVDSLQARFNRPNLTILVGESAIQSAINRGLSQSRDVRDCILGSRIVGTATLSGGVTADLLPSIGEVRLNVNLRGNVATRNSVYNGPVVLQTRGSGQVFASRVLHVTETSVYAEPAVVQASLTNQITSIQHPLRLVRRIAKKRAAEQKPKADRIAVDKLRSQVSGQFADETDRATAITPPQVLQKVSPVLKRLSLDEPTRTLGSTDDRVFIDATMRRGDQLSAIVSRPDVIQPFAVAIQLHESLIDNILAPVLAGRTLREGDVGGLMATAGLPPEVTNDATSDEGEDEDDEPPFEIDFARVRPIIFEARDQTLRVGVRGTRFASGRRELKRSLEISALYRPGFTDDGKAILIRQDDVDVSFSGSSGRLTVSQAGLKVTIQKKFADVFPEVLLDRTVTIPMTAEIESLRGRTYRATSIDAASGWLTVGVN